MAETQRPFTRTVLQRSDVPARDYEHIIALTEVRPNGDMGRHAHLGLEAAYVVQGSGTLSVEGQTAQLFKVGQSWNVPPGAVHDFRAGPAGAKLLASWVVEKSKPLAVEHEDARVAS